MELVRQTKSSINQKKSVQHEGILLYNGLTYAGTTCDDFMREHYKWVGKATHWSNFNATATFGMVHLGNHKNAKIILNPYFFKPGG